MITTLLANFVPPSTFHIQIKGLPHFASGSNPLPTSPHLLALMADPHHIPPGNPAFRRMSALSSPLPSRSGTPSSDQPLVFMAQQLARARNALGLTAQDHRNFNRETLSGTLLPNPPPSPSWPSLSKGWSLSHMSGVG